MRFLGYRILTGYLRDGALGPEASISKLFWSEYHQRMSELAMAIMGPHGLVPEGRRPPRAYRTDDPGVPNDTASWANIFLLNARAGTVYAGTSQVQRNILGETRARPPEGALVSMHVKWMFHATAMVRDYDAAMEPLGRIFGARVLHDNVVEDEGIGRRGGMTWIGDGSLEVGEPAGPHSPVQAFLDRFGGGMHSVGLQIDDAIAAKEHLASVGVRVVTEPFAGLFFTHPADTAGLLLEWNEHPQDDDPRWHARPPAVVATGEPVPGGPAPVVPVERLAFVAAVVRDPRAAAARLAAVLDTEVTFEAPGEVGAGEVGAAVSLVDCTLALTPLSGSSFDRPRVSGLGLLVGDRAEAEAAFAAAPGSEELPFPVHLCDRLLDGDPRLR